jgi:hypothetical protein
LSGVRTHEGKVNRSHVDGRLDERSLTPGLLRPHGGDDVVGGALHRGESTSKAGIGRGVISTRLQVSKEAFVGLKTLIDLLPLLDVLEQRSVQSAYSPSSLGVPVVERVHLV